MPFQQVRVYTARFLLAVLLTAVQHPSAGQAMVSRTPQETTPEVVQSASPSIVTLLLRDSTGKVLGTGSGFVVANDGKVLTNAHVIRVSGATQADAKFQDGSSYKIQGVIAIDSDHDLALLKLKAVGRVFPSLHLGNSDEVQVGQKVIAIGSPLTGVSEVSTEATVSDGIVSGKRDWPSGRMQVLQITAAISPGSSGGVLLNTTGEVVGVTFAQLREGQNLNFAIPVAYARGLLSADSAPRPLVEFVAVPVSESKTSEPEVSPAGSYTGVWQSGSYSVSGAATMTIKISGGRASADIFLTGGEVKSATLSGWAQKTGENIWTVELSSKHPNLSVRGIFRNGSFVGDYTYSRFLMLDRGQWILNKE